MPIIEGTACHASGSRPAAGWSTLKALIIMTQSAQRAAPRFLTPEFNSFLFAMVGTDRRGGQLSVVSALARLDLDAWAEAAVLARLSRPAAAQRLSALLAKFPEIPHITQEAGAIAARLVALLPGATALRSGSNGERSRRVAASTALALGILMVFMVMIGLQFTAHSPAGDPGATAASIHTPSSQAVAPRLP
jgi:hypothetical protein